VSEQPVPAGPTPLGALREAAALGVAALVTRGELAALELSEARVRAARWLGVALVAAVLCLAALLLAALWIVSIFWDSHRSAAIIAVASAYAALGALLVVWLSAKLRSAPPLFAATLNELKQDCDALRGASPPGR
jgi:uncharacterized membrane protein YqjE